MPAPRAACLPQPRHDPIAKRASRMRHPPSCSLVFSERKCTCVGCRGDWVFYLTSDLDGWDDTCVSSQPQWRNQRLQCLQDFLPLIPKEHKGKALEKSMDLGRSEFFQGRVGMGRVGFFSTQPVRKQGIKLQTSGDFLGGRIARGVKHSLHTYKMFSV